MRGTHATIPDVILDTLVLPANLLSNEESLSLDEEPEEEQFYRVDTFCHSCEARLRVCVVASTSGIHTLQILLIRELRLLCPSCSRNLCQHGRTN
uniref:Protein E7 n=1 Tax=Human papillomavirus TaxID=10566 RepID=A0A3R5T6T5_9PAPI|nr:MAG: E7 protein [Human papillomavirus]